MGLGQRASVDGTDPDEIDVYSLSMAAQTLWVVPIGLAQGPKALKVEVLQGSAWPSHVGG